MNLQLITEMTDTELDELLARANAEHAARAEAKEWASKWQDHDAICDEHGNQLGWFSHPSDSEIDVDGEPAGPEGYAVAVARWASEVIADMTTRGNCRNEDEFDRRVDELKPGEWASIATHFGLIRVERLADVTQ